MANLLHTGTAEQEALNKLALKELGEYQALLRTISERSQHNLGAISVRLVLQVRRGAR